MTINLCLIGFGNVGKGFIKYLMEHPLLDFYKVVSVWDSQGGIYRTPEIDRDFLLAAATGTTSIREYKHYLKGSNPLGTLRSGDVHIVVEATPTDLETGGPGLTYITEALRNGRHVVTSNKGPLALAFQELMELAKTNNVGLGYEGCVGASLPVIRTCRYLEPCGVTGVRGILNGTTNYILTRMAEGVSYEKALRQAQEIGVAETDPTLDVEGFDAAAKLVIVANTLGMGVTYRDMVERGDVKGISGISSGVIQRAAESSHRIKLIAQLGDNKTSVDPQKISMDSPLAQVNGTLNGVEFSTRLIGELFLSGKGAGGPETGLAILNDIREIGRKYRLF